MIKIKVLFIWILCIFIIQTDDSIISKEFFTNYFTDEDLLLWTKSGVNLPIDHFFTTCGTDRIFGGKFII
jgi:hypothetical protein